MGKVFTRPKDPYLYLSIEGKWYCYDTRSTPIGKGAMGDVYAGYELNSKGQAVGKVAIKRVKDYYANIPMVRDRALLEASLKFRHPNLVEMIGCCMAEAKSGPIFLLSNMVYGINADEYVRKMENSQNRVDKVCEIVCAVLDALHYMHVRRVFHRDVKPSNIMIETNDNVRLMDLGIARLNDGNKFSSNGFIGTPEFSAPEQIRGDNNNGVKNVPINETTDLYELGISFYELLTGENPMKGNSDAETLDRQMHMILPSRPDVIPDRLMRVILKATEKEQSKRYQKAEDFKHAIQDALRTPPTPYERLLAFVKANLIVTVISVALFVILVLALTLYLTTNQNAWN